MNPYRSKYTGSLPSNLTVAIRAGILRGYNEENQEFVDLIRQLAPDGCPMKSIAEVGGFPRGTLIDSTFWAVHTRKRPSNKHNTQTVFGRKKRYIVCICDFVMFIIKISSLRFAPGEVPSESYTRGGSGPQTVDNLNVVSVSENHLPFDPKKTPKGTEAEAHRCAEAYLESIDLNFLEHWADFAPRWLQVPVPFKTGNVLTQTHKEFVYFVLRVIAVAAHKVVKQRKCRFFSYLNRKLFDYSHPHENITDLLHWIDVQSSLVV